MTQYIRFILIIAAVIIAIIVLLFLQQDYKKQTTAIEGSAYRREHGEYSVGKFVEITLIKSRQWLRQRNGGVEPKLYKKKIEYTEHFEECNLLVSKKGL